MVNNWMRKIPLKQIYTVAAGIYCIEYIKLNDPQSRHAVINVKGRPPLY